MPEDKEFIIRCRGVILYEGKLLVVRHKADASFTALPGGHLEWGEDVLGCVRREIVEELGVEPQIGRLLYVNTFIDSNNRQPTEFFFEVTNGEEYLGCEELARSHAHELAEILWIRPEDDVGLLPQKLADDFKNGLIIADEVRYLKD
jgi:ADP-ribose pyrophosphatase YjhB (NUDIX family)